MGDRALSLYEPPRRGLGDVASTLRDFVTSTWDVDPDALARHLPDGLAPERVTLADGRERALVSAVSFTNERFHVGFAPFVKLTCAQTNYRAYVRRGEERAVWFFATSIATPLVAIPRYVWGLPWAWMREARSSASHVDAGLARLEWHGRSALGEERLRLRGTGEPLGRLDGFEDAETAWLVLTHPMVGYLRRWGRTVATYGVWHAPLELERCAVEDARFEHYERLGLVEPEQPAHSVLYQRATDYLIRLPPRRAEI